MRKELVFVDVEEVWDPIIKATPGSWFNWRHRVGAPRDSVWDVFWLTRDAVQTDMRTQK